MSLKIHVNSLSDNELDTASNDLMFRKPRTKYMYFQPYITVFETEGDNIYLPFNYAVNTMKKVRRPRSDFPPMKTSFTGEVRDYQVSIKDEALKLINTYGCCVLSLFTGCGKTFLATFLSTLIKLKAMIICHSVLMTKQWAKEITELCPNAKVQILTSKSQIDEDVDFYIIYSQNIKKYENTAFLHVGTLIADEVHIMSTDNLSKIFNYFQPRYAIALSATPYRSDGMDILINLFFSEHKVVRELNRKHTVYKVETGVKIIAEKNLNGTNWDSVLKQQAQSDYRYKIALNILKTFSDTVFIVICKRVEQAKKLSMYLEEMGENYTTLIGNQQEYNQNARILVGMSQKCGTGFNFKKANGLIAFCDLENYFIQFLGRCFREQHNEPIIFDFVDNNYSLKKHFETRVEVYKKHGGVIKRYNIE